jgi:DNA recombination protein Rad52
MTCTFSAEQITALSAPLDRAKVRQRRQGRSQVSYLEGWQVIAEANRIFGFDGWQRETVALRCVHQAERLIGEEQRPGWGVTYTARVRISVSASTAGQPALIREGCGAGHGIDTDLGQAHESALKEAETDAMKRALMTFGNAFGLALYDKQQRRSQGGPWWGRSLQQRPGQPAQGNATAGGAPSANSSHSQDPRKSSTRPRPRRHRKLSHPQRCQLRQPSNPQTIPVWRPSIRPPSASCTPPSAPARARAGGVQQGLPQALPGAGRGPFDRRSHLPAAAPRLDRDILVSHR